MLAGCGGSQPPIGAPGAMPQGSPMASSFYVLYRFSGGTAGANPDASLIDVKGMLYGATTGGGGSKCYGGCGIVYSMSTTGSVEVVHTFTGGADGAGPVGLTNVKDRFYGTTDSMARLMAEVRTATKNLAAEPSLRSPRDEQLSLARCERAVGNSTPPRLEREGLEELREPIQAV
ncbi:MAG: hypothetical protein WCC84_08290 [Candidatus Cybelea sp.]